MKMFLRSLAVVCVCSCAVAAAEAPPASQPPAQAPGAKPPSPDAPFIGAAAMDARAEVELARLAAQHASSPRVKRFAQRLAGAHQRAVDEVNGLASQKEVALATKLDDQHQAALDGLAKLTGSAFDQAYMAHTVKAHLQAVGLFQQEVKEGQDPTVKAWATKMLPTLQEHVRIASSVNASVNKAGK